MGYSKYYGGLIWTDHAIEKMRERYLPQSQALYAFKNPDSKVQGKTPGSLEFVKHENGKTITLIAKKNQEGEFIVISAWIDPPLPGTKDAKQKENYKKMQKASFLGKIFLTLKSQLGL